MRDWLSRAAAAVWLLLMLGPALILSLFPVATPDEEDEYDRAWRAQAEVKPHEPAGR